MGEGLLFNKTEHSAFPYIPCSWASGTDAQIAEAVAKDRAGEIDLHRFWSVGDTRTVSLSAMAGVVLRYQEATTGSIDGRIRIGRGDDSCPYPLVYSTEQPTFNSTTGVYAVSSSSQNLDTTLYLYNISTPTSGALQVRCTNYEPHYIPIYDNNNTNAIGYYYIGGSSVADLGNCLETSNWPTWSGATSYVKFSTIYPYAYSQAVTDTPHAAQSVQLVLMDSTCTGFTWASTPESGITVPKFIVGMKNCLNEADYMNETSTNTGGWRDCIRRKWCNDNFKNSLPSELKGIFKEFTWQTGAGGGASSGLNTTTDTFALPPEKAIFGSRSYSFSEEAALYSQWTWYQTAANRKKIVNVSANAWWECSPYASQSSRFGCVLSGGTASYLVATTQSGLSPFGCI